MRPIKGINMEMGRKCEEEVDSWEFNVGKARRRFAREEEKRRRKGEIGGRDREGGKSEWSGGRDC